MSSGSNIEWTDASWQVTSGCTKVSPGCKNCYAETMANRLAGMAHKDLDAGRDPKGKASYLKVITNGAWNRKVVTLPENLEIPWSWKKPRLVFVNSMSDLFHEDVPFDFVDQVFITMAMTEKHTYQVLTKRPERMAKYFARPWADIRSPLPELMLHKLYPTSGPPWKAECIPWPVPNVWCGTSVENQETADKRTKHLRRCMVAVRFLSVEPLLGPVTLALDGINWVIVGGESGHDARPCDVAWIRSVVRQCAEAGVPCFVKQLGAVPRTGYYDDEWRERVERDGGTWPEPIGWKISRDGQPRTDAVVAMKLKSRKGGDPAEWPADLRVRQMPARQAVPS